MSAIMLSLAVANCGGSSPCPPIEEEGNPGSVTPGGSVDPTTLEYAPELGIPFDRMSTLSEGLYCLDHPARQGRGSGVWRDDKRPLHPGYHPDGSVFDSSRERAPFPVFVGAGQVISGWNLGIVGMQVEQPTGGKTPEGEPEVRRREIISDLGPTESSTLAVRTEGVEVGTLTATKK